MEVIRGNARLVPSFRDKRVNRFRSGNELTYEANGWRHRGSVLTGAWRLAYPTDCHRFGANGEVSFGSMSRYAYLNRPSLTSLLIRRLTQM